MSLGRTITTPLRRFRPASALVNSFAQTSIRRAAAMSTVSDALIKDHRELEDYYQNIVNATDDDTRTRWQNQFTWELARHSIGEELVVYPAFEKHLGAEGKKMADKDRAEHQVVCMPLPAMASARHGIANGPSAGQGEALQVPKHEAPEP